LVTWKRKNDNVIGFVIQKIQKINKNPTQPYLTSTFAHLSNDTLQLDPLLLNEQLPLVLLFALIPRKLAALLTLPKLT
jgi:hypothetical protein